MGTRRFIDDGMRAKLEPLLPQKNTKRDARAKTHGVCWMGSSWLCEPERPSGICRKNLGRGKPVTRGCDGGRNKVHGKICLRS